MAKARLKQVGVLDIDGTLMTRDMEHGHATPASLAAAHFVREYFDAHGTFMVATAQTAEMVMSSDSHVSSSKKGFSRPVPLLGGVPGAHFYVRPEQIPCRVPFTDATAVMSMGTGCFFKKPDGSYAENKAFKERLGTHWRRDAFRLLNFMSEGDARSFEQYLAPIEFEENYRQGRTNVLPLEYRIQFNFTDRETKDFVKNQIHEALRGLKQLKEISGITHADLTAIEEEFGHILRNLRIVDESSPSIGKYQFYMMPRFASKEDMIDETLAVLSRGEMIEHLLIAGDMPPDLRAGCYAGRALHVTFLLVGGSPLTPYFTRGSDEYGKSYAGEDMHWMIDHLSETNRNGFEVLHRAGVPSRMIVFGDIAYPGLTGPETIAAFLRDTDKPTLD